MIDHLAAALAAVDDAEASPFGSPRQRVHLARAQVHATLAVAEALGLPGAMRAVADLAAWDDEQGDDGAAS